jgi:hypothetical protein
MPSSLATGYFEEFIEFEYLSFAAEITLAIAASDRRSPLEEDSRIHLASFSE